VRLKPQIKAYFLLGIFLLTSVHQIFPHAHHEHQEEKKEIAHHHHGDEDHHHHDKKEKEQEGFITYLLALHSHSGSTNEIPVLKDYSENYSFQKSENKKKVSENPFIGGEILIDQDSSISEIYYPPRKYFNPYLSFLSLRGPPALG
jgi:ABC-type Zn2+ transport system substrate-binding protein/surface adhesin